LAIQELLCKFFQGVISGHPDDLLMCVYLCCNKLAPAYVGLELGIGDSLLIKALAEASGTSRFFLLFP
jgi:DNA ligase-1